MKDQFTKEVDNLLKVFEEAYIQRDSNKIDEFMEMLFDNEENIIIIGTSGGEWCIGYEEAKDLFVNDWKYWCDLRIDRKKAIIKALGNTAFIHVPGTIEYTFDSGSNTYSDFSSYIKGFFDGKSFDSKKPDKVKLTEINWVLCHLLNHWEGDIRNYLWDIRISFILVRKESRWVIRQMQFSLPSVGHLPDERLDSKSYDIECFASETKKLELYQVNNTHKPEIINFLLSFHKDFTDSSAETLRVIEDYFSKDQPVVINTDNTDYHSEADLEKLITQYRDFYDCMELDIKNCLVDSNENVVWLATHGTLKKTISEEEAYQNTIKDIKKIFESSVGDRDKLFKIRRRIAETLKENARGENYVWPFRLEAVVVKENNSWKFKYLQFSFPFNIVLEGKTEAARRMTEN